MQTAQGGVIGCDSIPNEDNAISVFNRALEAFLGKLSSHFPSHEGLRDLAAFAAGIVRIDNHGLLIGVRLVLDSFPASLYPLIQNRNDDLWKCTKLIGVSIHELWTQIPADIKDEQWLKLAALVNAANVVGQIPPHRLVQLNMIIANSKDMLAAVMPYITEMFQSASQELAQAGGGSPVAGLMSSILGGMGGARPEEQGFVGVQAPPQVAGSWGQGGAYHDPFQQMYHPQ